MKSPKLQVAIVEHILISCINESSIYELSFEVQRLFPFPYSALKQYLFYLTDYDLIRYDGQKRAYHIKEKGLKVLYQLKKKM